MEKVKFQELNCSEEIKKAIADMGFEEATPIQAMSIPLVLEGKDVVGQAQTGTGKTAAFGIPLIDKIDTEDKNTQGLILCPTRELAVQVSEEMSKIAKYKKNLKIMPVFGGQPIDRQIKGLRRGAHIVIGTPGRVLDHMRRKTLKLKNLKVLILDEADEMLNMGFREDIETVLEGIENEERQTLLFSATMPRAILEIINKYQNNPEIVKVAHKELTTPNISQWYLEMKEKDKLEVASRLIDVNNPKLSIIFCNTKKKVDDVTSLLQMRGYLVDKIHGDMKQAFRLNVIDKFKSGDVEILVATDVAARGLDIDDVECVINYDVPSHEDYYVHRIGRTGRAGREGQAFSFVTKRDFYLLKNIMRYTKKKIKRMDIPTISDIENVKVEAFKNRLKNKIEEGKLKKYINIIEKFMEDDEYTSVEIAAALVKMELEMENTKEVEIIDFSKNDRSKGDRSRRDGNNKRSRGDMTDTGAKSGMVRMFINVGKAKKIRVNDVVGAIAGETGIKGNNIGDIDIYDNYTFVEVPEKYAEKVLTIMSKNTIKGNKIVIEPANGKTKRRKRKGK